MSAGVGLSAAKDTKGTKVPPTAFRTFFCRKGHKGRKESELDQALENWLQPRKVQVTPWCELPLASTVRGSYLEALPELGDVDLPETVFRIKLPQALQRMVRSVDQEYVFHQGRVLTADPT